MGFTQDELRKARGRKVTLMLESQPICVEGRLVFWRHDSLLLDSDTVVFNPAGDGRLRPLEQDGMTAVPFRDIKNAAL